MTTARPKLTPGEVCLCEVVFTDYSEVKTRPAVVLSTCEYESGGEDVIIAAITSRTESPQRYKVVLSSADDGFAETGLRRSSAVLCSKLLTIHVQKLTRRLGSLPQEAFAKVQETVQSALGL